MEGTLKYSGIIVVLLLAMASLVYPLPGWTQRENPSALAPQGTVSARQGSSPVAPSEEESSPAVARTDSAAGIPNEPRVTEIGKAGLLQGSFSPLSWGPVSVRSLQFYQLFRGGNSNAGPIRDRWGSASIFLANIAYDKRFRRSRLAVQYAPRVGVINGVVDRNLTDQDTRFDSYYILSRKWSVSLGDGFSYRGNRNQNTTEAFLDADAATGTIIQNNFVDGPASMLSNSIALTFNHQWSARTRVSFGPEFTYAYAGRTSDTVGPISSHTYSARGRLEHLLSTTKGVNVSYSFQQIAVLRSLAATGYHALSAGYSQRITPTFHLSLGVGASSSRFAGTPRQWSTVGSLNLVKSFMRSYLALSYVRGHGFSGYVNNGYSTRTDLAYGIQATRRLNAQLGVGYEQTSSTLANPVAPMVKISAKYASGQLNYRLLSQLSWFMSYAFKDQFSTDPQILTGNRHYISTGLRWNPGSRNPY